MTAQELLDAGYKFFEASGNTFMNHSDGLYQKRVKAGDATLYFVDVFWYDNRREGRADGWMPEVYFKTQREQGFVVKLICESGTAVAEIERFFAGMYAAMSCQPYED